MDIAEQREQMIREWGLQDLAPAEQDDVIEKIGQTLYQSTVVRAMALMDESQHAELDKFTESKGDNFNAADALQWLREHVSGFDQIAEEERVKLRERIFSAPR